MKPLTLTLRRRPRGLLDVSPLTPDRLAGLAPGRVKSVPLRMGVQQFPLAAWFDLRGRDSSHLVFARASDRFLHLGRGMSHGSIRVEGDAGHCLGQGMTGGEILVCGNAGDWAATGMAGGTIHIRGNAGDFVGAPAPGDFAGMSNGYVFIRGDAGDRLGDGMRRGTVLVLGSAGEFAGSRMQAGTIIILGRTGRYPGHGMRRGTIVLAKQPAQFPLTFASCGNLKMEFLRLLFKQLAGRDSEFAFFRQFGPEAHRLAGDRASGGQGEILVLLNASSAPKVPVQ